MAGICASEMSRRIAYGSVLCLCKGNNIQARWFYVYRHGRPFSRRLVAVHKWLVYRQRLEHRLFLHAQQPFGTGLKIAAWAGGVIHPRRCRVPAGLHLPGRHRHPAVPVHFPGGCRGRYLFVPRPRLRRCTDCASQTVKERRYCVWNYMQGIIWSSSSWV